MKLNTLIVLALASGLALSGSWSTPAHANPSMGGQDVLIGFPGFNQQSLLLDVTAATDGTLFAACHGDPGLDILNIYRSTDGGTTWDLWDQITSEYLDGRVHQAELITTTGDPGSLMVAWIDQRLDAPFSSLRFSMAGVAEDIPSWTTGLVGVASGWEMHDPRLDLAPWLIGTNRVGLAWRHGDTVRFSTSYSTGTTWSAPVVVGTTTPDAPIQDLDLALDFNEFVHLSYVTFNETQDSSSVFYNQAGGGGTNASDWAGEVSIYSVALQEMISVSMAADPGFSGDLVIAAGGELGSYTPLRIFSSSSNGSSWDLPVLYSFHSHPDLAWGQDGPVMVTDFADPDQIITDWTVMTRNGTTWVAETIIKNAGEGARRAGAALALDPSREDQPLVVALRTLLSSMDEYALWFNAAWRDEPGYGVPDPHDLHRTAGRALTHPVLAGDLNGDGTREVVFVEDSPIGVKRVFFYDPEGVGFMYGNYEMDMESEVALIDINGDGDLEAFWINDDHEVEGRRVNGGRVAGFPLDLDLGTGPFWISGARVTGNVGQDLVIATDSSVHVIGQNGVARPGWPWIAPHAAGLNYGRVALGDVDGDGQCDLVVPMTGRVVVLDRFGQVMELFGDGLAAPGSPSLADINGDGDLEIAIPRLDGTVHLVHHDGTTVSENWPYDTGNNGMPSQVALADFGGDTRRDLIFMDNSHVLHAVTPAGTVLLQKEADVDPFSPVVDPIVAQIGPDEVTIAVGLEDGVMRVIGPSGKQEGWPRDMADPISAAAAVADVDGDGIVEMIVPTQESLWVLDMGVAVPDSLQLWPMSGFDPGRSGCTEALGLPVSSVDHTPASRMALHGAAPNPFNPRTTISFSLGTDALRASLRIYDVAGRLVRTLHQGALPAGEHTVIWQGKDESGHSVASGVYYYRLEAGNQAETRSMVLVR
jgi:hypothetical protein